MAFVCQGKTSPIDRKSLKMNIPSVFYRGSQRLTRLSACNALADLHQTSIEIN